MRRRKLTIPTRKKEKRAALRLLPAQREFLNKQCKFPCFVGGFGSGKSYTLVAAALRDAVANPGKAVGLFAPTYDLLELILIDRVRSILTEQGVDFTYNKSKFFIEAPGMARLIFRSLDNPARIVGFEVVSSHIDELDTMPEKKARDAWRKVLGRTRAANNRGFNQACVYTTPEGMGFVYKTWGKNPKPGYELVKAQTMSNPFLPVDYVENLRNDYPEELVKAYLNGEFCNLSTGTVYYNFNRYQNDTKRKLEGSDRVIHVGMDFNVTNMNAVALIDEGGRLYAVDEICGAYDTRDIIKLMRQRWGKRQIIVYPDASGGNRHTSSSVTDIDLLKKEFKVKVGESNPLVRDRVNLLIGLLCNANGERNLLINCDQCPSLAEALENQTYDERTGAPDKSGGFDHLADCLGYVTWGLRAARRRSVKPSGIRLY